MFLVFHWRWRYKRNRVIFDWLNIFTAIIGIHTFSVVLFLLGFLNNNFSINKFMLNVPFILCKKSTKIKKNRPQGTGTKDCLKNVFLHFWALMTSEVQEVATWNIHESKRHLSTRKKCSQINFTPLQLSNFKVTF